MFLIDATTGGDALMYDETQPVPCGGTGVIPASVAVPIEQTSVPWTLDRRNPDRFSALLTVSVPPCDFHDSVTGVIPGTSLVRVLAYGTVAARCGRPRPVTVHVGDVLAPPGLFPGEDPDNARPARSSDPAALGPLGIPGQGPFAEFRASRPGRATLTIPAQTWLVHVIVLARS